MYDQFTKQNMNVMRKAVEAALEPLGIKFGMNFKMGDASFSNYKFEAKLVCTIGDIENSEREDFVRYCNSRGFKPDDYGKEFEYDGNRYKFISFRPKARTYPCVCRCIDGPKIGSSVCFTKDSIKRYLSL